MIEKNRAVKSCVVKILDAEGISVPRQRLFQDFLPRKNRLKTEGELPENWPECTKKTAITDRRRMLARQKAND
ncbi:hypothetical protein [Pararhizobium sp. O133]|uniref:hypothetical protein n=1 Tax=Pararhizobium sp. O133 TaxID=3449278 RepID=UPI003F683864